MQRYVSKGDPGAHVVVVDDDPAVRATLRDCLNAEGYKVSEASNRAELISVIDEEPVDLITLDLKMIPDDGLTIAREIRQRLDVPIIMVTAKDDPLDRVIGLEVGADDYIAKPFHLREVLARVRSVLRRYHLPEEGRKNDRGVGAERFFFDGWVLDCHRRRVQSPSGGRGSLTTTEFKLLKMFLEHANRVLTRNQIMDLVNGPSWFANDRAVDNQVRRLRRKLESIDSGNEMIQSVRGEGYVFAARVKAGS